jgi:hypothetical protein
MQDNWEKHLQVNMAERINADFDHVVLPLSNVFREKFTDQLENFSDVIEKLKVPVTIVGSGAQQRLDKLQKGDAGSSDKLDKATRRFISACLDRSASVGVRGEYTKDYLLKLGFKDEQIRIIGCPSLAMYGNNTEARKPEKKITKLALSLYPSEINDAKIAEIVRRLYKDYENLTYVTQDQTELRMLLWGLDFGKSEWNQPTSIDHPLYRDRKIRFYLDSLTWIKAMAKQDFTIGPRLHGAIASLLAGTPAYIFAWDTRTLELAKYHKMPYIEYSNVQSDFDVQAAYDSLSFDDFNSQIAVNNENYTAFMKENDIDVQLENSAFDEKLEKCDFPAPVSPLYMDTPEQRELVRKVRWLYQNFGTDTMRRDSPLAYSNVWEGGVGGYPPPPRILQKRMEPLEFRLDAAEIRINELISAHNRKHKYVDKANSPWGLPKPDASVAGGSDSGAAGSGVGVGTASLGASDSPACAGIGTASAGTAASGTTAPNNIDLRKIAASRAIPHLKRLLKDPIGTSKKVFSRVVRTVKR